MAEALTNVVINAAEAMSESGVIEIKGVVKGNKVALTVSDTGEGMTDEVRQRCLEPFFSAKGPANSGLGLTTVVAAAGRYGGTVDIDSTPEKGTTLTLTLSIFKKEKRPRRDTELATKRALRLRILVVDDEPWVHKILNKALASEKHTVTSAMCGQEGVRHIDRQFCWPHHKAYHR